MLAHTTLRGATMPPPGPKVYMMLSVSHRARVSYLPTLSSSGVPSGYIHRHPTVCRQCSTPQTAHGSLNP